jgi:choline-sulfatase
MADDVCRFLEDAHRSPEPFMLWVDCFDVHEPWFPPAYLLDLYQPRYDGLPVAQPNYREASHFRPDELENMRARYRAMCTLLSKAVGRMFRTIEDAGLLENSIVTFMSDHGMYLGERGRTGKSGIQADGRTEFPFHREIADICWTMHVPPSLGLATVRGDTRVPGLVQAPDLMPTILELCGVTAPPAAKIEGASLVSLLAGERQGPRPVAITTTTRTDGTDWVHCCRPAVTDGAWKLMLDEGPSAASAELYRVATDPGETVNVLVEERAEADRLHAAMQQWLQAHDAAPATVERLSAERVGLA